MNTPKEITWRERFDERFGGWILQDDQEVYRGYEPIMDFFSSELQGIISDLEDEKIVNSIDAGQFALHTDGYNQGLENAQEIIRRRLDK